jgi:hypothetical protein
MPSLLHPSPSFLCSLPDSVRMVVWFWFGVVVPVLLWYGDSGVYCLPCTETPLLHFYLPHHTTLRACYLCPSAPPFLCVHWTIPRLHTTLPPIPTTSGWVLRFLRAWLLAFCIPDVTMFASYYSTRERGILCPPWRLCRVLYMSEVFLTVVVWWRCVRV